MTTNEAAGGLNSVRSAVETDTKTGGQGKRRPLPLTLAQRRQRQLAPLKTGAYAAEYGVKLRQRRLRDRVRRLIQANPRLADKPRTLVLRYLEADLLAAVLWNHLFEHGPLGPDGEVRRAVSEYRYLAAELRALAENLGLMQHADRLTPLDEVLRGNA